ncbi:MAG: hypothetical protein WC238_02765 [Parcubacteria group bacterium]
MASQISHIIYARKYLEKHPMPNGDADLFLLGCVFPDIRRIDDTIKRKDTHLCFDSLDLNFAGMAPFIAGWKFHLYCDMKREEILNKYGFYELDNAANHWHLPAKILEDELIYNEYNNWEKLISFFNNAPYFDAGIGVTPETFSLWYAILAKYMEKKPDDRTMHVCLSKQINLAEKADEIVKTIDKLRKNEKVRRLLKKVAEEII